MAPLTYYMMVAMSDIGTLPHGSAEARVVVFVSLGEDFKQGKPDLLDRSAQSEGRGPEPQGLLCPGQPKKNSRANYDQGVDITGGSDGARLRSSNVRLLPSSSSVLKGS